MLRPRTFVSAAALCVAFLAPAALAEAEVIVKGTGEPPFTNSANNTQWVEWSNNGNYRVEFQHSVNGGATVVDGPYQVNPRGSTSVNWSGIRGVSIPLQEGSTYRICGFGRWDDGTGMYFPDFSTSCGDADRRGLRASTTIDRTPPAIGVALAGGAAATKNPSLPFRINFTDNIAGPFPANFLCVQYGDIAGAGVCDSNRGYRYIEQPACSQPLTGGRNTAFDCTVEVGGGTTPAPDGVVYVCAMAADAAIPDNPHSDDQRASSQSANRSAPQCDGILLDRAAPAVTVQTSRTTVQVGELVTFDAAATDATSGLNGQYKWTYGDNTAEGTGQSTSHTYTQPGTFEVTVQTADNAGNAATAKKVITVKPKDSTGDPDPDPSPSPTATPQPTPTSTPGTQPTPQPTPTSTPGTQPTPQPTATSTSHGDGGKSPESGTKNDGKTGSGTTTTTTTGGQAAGTLEIVAPKQLKLARNKAGKLALTLKTNAPGTLQVTLSRSGRIVSQGTARATAAGSLAYKLKLPRNARGGKHVLKVTFTPAGGGKAATASKNVTLVAPKAKGKKKASYRRQAADDVVSVGGLRMPTGRYDGPAVDRRVVVQESVGSGS